MLPLRLLIFSLFFLLDDGIQLVIYLLSKQIVTTSRDRSAPFCTFLIVRCFYLFFNKSLQLQKLTKKQLHLITHHLLLHNTSLGKLHHNRIRNYTQAIYNNTQKRRKKGVKITMNGVKKA